MCWRNVVVGARPRVKIQALMLCDSANVREGLLNVLSAGITRIGSPVFPCQLGVTLAVICEVSVEESAVHQLSVTVKYEDDTLVGRVQGGLTVERTGGNVLNPAESVLVPTVIPIELFMIHREGRYDVTVAPDNNVGVTLEVWFFKVDAAA